MPTLASVTAIGLTAAVLQIPVFDTTSVIVLRLLVQTALLVVVAR